MIRSGDQAVFEATIRQIPELRRRYAELERLEGGMRSLTSAVGKMGIQARVAAQRMAVALRSLERNVR